MSWIAKELAQLRSQVSELSRRVENTVRQGKIAEVDHEKGLARIEVGKDSDGTPQLGPWMRTSQMAGALKIHAPATVGQTYMQIAPGGDFEQGLLMPLGWSTENPSPGQSADPVLTFGALRIETDGQTMRVTIPKILLECGGASFQLTDDGLKLVANLAVEGESMTHNDLNVGSTHVHDGVVVGGADTLGPH